jgi:hypothetical protein
MAAKNVEEGAAQLLAWLAIEGQRRLGAPLDLQMMTDKLRKAVCVHSILLWIGISPS